MEAMTIDELTESEIYDYTYSNNLVKYEHGILDEMLNVISTNNIERLKWFASFGKTIRQVNMNIYAYRKGLEFGFTEIAFDKYGWLARPEFLESEIIKLGASEIRIGRGINHIWTYALSYTYGTAGGGSSISVYDKPFKNRETALNTALIELKSLMQMQVGNTDTSNYKQVVINRTIQEITDYKYKDLQMTLF